MKFQIQSLSRIEKEALAVHVTSKNKNVPHLFGGNFGCCYRLRAVLGPIMMRASLLQTIFSIPRSLHRNYTRTTTTSKNHIEILEALQDVYSLSLDHSLYPFIPSPSAPNLHPPTIQLHPPPRRRIQARTSPTTPSKRGAGALRGAAKSVYRSVQHTEGSPQNQSISSFYRVERSNHQSYFGGHPGARRRYKRRRRRAPSEYKEGG